MNFYKIEAMKRFTTFVTLISLCFTFTNAQAPQREKLDAYKIAFLTRRLNLTPDEAEKFWPLYNEYQNRRMEIQQERAQLNRQFGPDAKDKSEKEYEHAADSLIELQVAETDLAVKFHKNIRSVLPPSKMLRLYQSENQYRILLLNQIRDRQPPGEDLRRNNDLRPRRN